VRLTAAGEVLVPLAQRVLADVETAQAELDALAGLRRGRVRLGLIQTSGGTLDLAAVMGDFHRRFPEIEFEVMSEPSAVMVEAVSAGTLDLAVVGLLPDDAPAGLERQLLSREPLVAVVAPRHPLAGRARVDLAEFAPHRAFIHFRRGTGIRRYVEAAFARAGVAVPAGFEVSQVHDMIRLAAQDVGATVVPRSAATWLFPPGHGREDFRVLRLTDPGAIHPTSVVFDAARLPPAASAFLGVLREHADRAPAGHLA
jgi:DNA-binding transcriptional LysR family regulator